MRTQQINSIGTGKRAARVAAITGALLLIPLIAMQFDNGVNWSASDFVVAGALLFVVGLVYELLIRRLASKDWRYAATVLLIFAFMYIWAELAVGIFTNWGS
ncbi:MAG TPA: hypothetical protein VFK03_01500 [Candidatus Saccharimonadales bacterium]|nr:hypothetical protein [Candidatus Saccharimonadales bacterium]